jgi:hypothetical protein
MFKMMKFKLIVNQYLQTMNFLQIAQDNLGNVHDRCFGGFNKTRQSNFKDFSWKNSDVFCERYLYVHSLTRALRTEFANIFSFAGKNHKKS